VKIRPTILNPAQVSDKKNVQKTYNQKKEAPTNKQANTSSVQLSATARALQQLQNNDQDIRTERVQAIKNALDSGTLKINTNAIANGLIQSAKELLK